MTRRETVIQALNHKETDQLPWFVELTGQEYETVAKALATTISLTGYGDKLSFWGTISTQKALPNLTPEEVKQKIRDTVRIMRKGGGFILAPTHAIPNDVPVENVFAMLEEFSKY